MHSPSFFCEETCEASPDPGRHLAFRTMGAPAGSRAAARLLHASVWRPAADWSLSWLECGRSASVAGTRPAAATPFCEQPHLLAPQQCQQQRWTTGPGKGTTHSTTFPSDPPYHPQVPPACKMPRSSL